LETHPGKDFSDIIRLAQTIFAQVVNEIDTSPMRAILRMQAQYGPYRIFVTELTDQNSRKYRYYVLREANIEAGFDNAPDPRALRLKYGQIGDEHVGELIPHLHRANKTELSLTNEMFFADFVAWLQQNLSH
jgi:hypothetical protein